MVVTEELRRNVQLVSGDALVRHQVIAPVRPVNPHNSEIGDLACYPDSGGVLGPVGLVGVNSTHGPAVVSACGHAGVRFVAAVSSGIADEFDGADRPMRAVVSVGDDVGCHSAE